MKKLLTAAWGQRLATLASQALFTLSSAGAVLIASFLGGPSEAGVVALALIPYNILVTFIEPLAIQPQFIVQRQGLSLDGESGLGVASLLSLCAALAALCLGVTYDGVSWLPVVLATGTYLGGMQSYFRTANLMMGSGRSAVASDALWVASQAVVLAICFAELGGSSAGKISLLGWSLGAVVGILIFMSKRIPGPPFAFWRFLRPAWTNLPLAGESAQGQVMAQLSFGLVGAILGTGVLGLWRSSYLLFSPLLLLTSVVRISALPAMNTARTYGESTAKYRRRLTIFLYVVSTVNLLAALLIASQVPTWRAEASAGVLILVFGELLLASITMVSSLLLRVHGHIAEVLRLRLMVSLCQVAGILIACVVNSPTWGVALVPVVANVFLWIVITRLMGKLKTS